MRLDEYHVLRSEYACKHCGKLPPSFYDDEGEIDLIFSHLLRGFKKVREDFGAPLKISSGYRCEAHHKALYAQYIEDLAAGKSPMPVAFLSPHIFGMALDIDTDDERMALEVVGLLRKLSPRPRIGWKAYGGRLVHMDYAQFVFPRPSTAFKEFMEW